MGGFQSDNVDLIKSWLVQPYFSIPNGAGQFGEVTRFPSLKRDRTLSFLTEEGIAQMGSPNVWPPNTGDEGSYPSCRFHVKPNGHPGGVKFTGGTPHPAEVETGMSSCCSNDPWIFPLSLQFKSVMDKTLSTFEERSPPRTREVASSLPEAM